MTRRLALRLALLLTLVACSKTKPAHKPAVDCAQLAAKADPVVELLAATHGEQAAVAANHKVALAQQCQRAQTTGQRDPVIDCALASTTAHATRVCLEHPASPVARAARLFENSGFSIANVANHLDYSSPQSFGRHIRTLLHTTAGEFREQYDCASMFARFRTDLITPYLDGLRVLKPLTAPAGWSAGRPANRRFQGRN